MGTIRAKNTLFFALIVAILLLPTLKSDPNLIEVNTKIFRDGWVRVTETYTTNKSFIFLELPESSEIVAVIGGNEPLPYKASNTTVYIETRQKNEIKVIYYTQSFTNKIGSIWTVKLNFNTTNLTVEFPPDTTIAGLSAVPQLISQQDDTILLKFTTGNITLRYYLSPPDKNEKEQTSKAPQNTEQGESENTTPMPSETTTDKSQEAAKTTSQPQNPPLQPLALGVAASTSALLAFLLYRAKKRDVPARLSEEEADIIRFLKKSGGKAYQSDIMRALGIPKTTTWRYVKKLEEKNLVKIEKKGGKNLVVLK